MTVRYIFIDQNMLSTTLSFFNALDAFIRFLQYVLDLPAFLIGQYFFYFSNRNSDRKDFNYSLFPRGKSDCIFV